MVRSCHFWVRTAHLNGNPDWFLVIENNQGRQTLCEALFSVSCVGRAQHLALCLDEIHKMRERKGRETETSVSPGTLKVILPWEQNGKFNYLIQ